MRFEPTTSRTTTWHAPLLFWTVLTARYGLGFFDALVMLTQGEPGYPPPLDQSITISATWPVTLPKALQACQDSGVDVLSSRILLRSADLDRTRRFYRDVLGLAIYREFGPPEDPWVVFFLGSGFLEVSGQAASPSGPSAMIWIQVRDVYAEHRRLAAAGVRILREPAAESWGLIEMWIEDPDGIQIVLVEVPADHPLRRDSRAVSPPR